MIPLDEPIGQMNLWWPPTVSYAKSQLNREPESSATFSAIEQSPEATKVEPETNLPPSSWPESDSVDSVQPPQLDGIASLGKEQLAERVFAPVDRETLAPDEFRLACLSSVSDNSFPIHLSLETYSHDNCPEYETVSYTWGGEDGDSTLCRPIYIGPYWDLLLQTRNCWEMLRFIRPWRGIRMVWVDALCINQKNIKERGEQVAKMGRIYEECSRVIVYLGADLVLSPPDRFPCRHQLHELEGSSICPQLPDNYELQQTSLNLEELLKRRYFSRVWVIQELILSQRAIIRVGNLDLWADHRVWTHLPAEGTPSSRWDSMAAPWVQHMAQKTFPVKNIYELMRLTSKSQAADPRDRLFGVLTLIQNDAQERTWQPDYSLSGRHVFVGFFAHCIINLKLTHLFLHAGGLSASSSPPSWIPNWTSQEAWQRIFSSPELNINMLTGLIMKNLPTVRNPNNDRFGLHHLQSSNKRNQAFKIPPWHRDIVVGIDTGALSIYLTRFCTLNSRPVLLKRHRNMGIFELRGSNAVLFLTCKVPLEEVTQPGKDHVFILNPGDADLIYLILRELDSPKSYKIVACCQYLFIGFPTSQSSKKSVTEPLELEDLQKSVYEKVYDARRMLNQDLSSPFLKFPLSRYFPGVHNFWEMLPACRGMLNEEAGSSPGFEQSYVACINPRFKPLITDKFIQFTFKPEDWPGVSHAYLGEHQYARDDGAQWLDGKTWELIQQKQPSASSTSLLGGHRSHTVQVSIPMEVVRRQFLKHENIVTLNYYISRLQGILKISFDEVVALLRSGPQQEDRFIGFPTSFGEVEKDFDIDGSTYQVQIL